MVKDWPAEEEVGIVDELIEKLFEMQDLNGNGFLEEEELVQLNKKVAILHSGKDFDKAAVKAKFQGLFRELDADGEPVPISTFKEHIRDVLRSIDRHEDAQVLILEQWLMEADLARQTFRQMPSMHSLSDLPFLLTMPRESAEGARQMPQVPTTSCNDLRSLHGAEDSLTARSEAGVVFTKGCIARVGTMDSAWPLRGESQFTCSTSCGGDSDGGTAA